MQNLESERDDCDKLADSVLLLNRLLMHASRPSTIRLKFKPVVLRFAWSALCNQPSLETKGCTVLAQCAVVTHRDGQYALYTATLTGWMLLSTGCAASLSPKLPRIFRTSRGTGFRTSLSALKPWPSDVSAAYTADQALVPSEELLDAFASWFGDGVMSERHVTGLELKMRTPVA
jgi:hypothetical protein